VVLEVSQTIIARYIQFKKCLDAYCMHVTSAEDEAMGQPGWSVSVSAECTLCVRCPLLQNLSLNIADKGFPISVFNRSYEKTEAAVARAQKEGGYTSS
jgi:hypothetical protein